MSEPPRPTFRTFLGHAITCVITLAVAFVVLKWIYSTEPVAQKETATLKQAMLVEVQTVERGEHRPLWIETGTVEAARRVELSPQVMGRVIDVHPQFLKGGRMRKGEVLLRIDPADLELQVQQRRSELVVAEAELALEMGLQKVAKVDAELMQKSLEQTPTELTLRKPQLQSASAAVEMAESALAQAILSLQRTELTVPFDAMVMDTRVEIGARVSPGTVVAELASTETYWVVASMAPSKLAMLDFEQGLDMPSVEMVRRSQNHALVARGHLRRWLGELEEGTRFAKVVIEVPSPLTTAKGSKQNIMPGEGPISHQGPLLLGEFLEVRIPGKILKDCVRLPLEYLRRRDTVWVMNRDDALEIRKAEVPFRDDRHAYLVSGLEHGDRVVTSNLSRVRDGAALRTGAHQQHSKTRN
jgi:RND family efflux transporter MFP subunit